MSLAWCSNGSAIQDIVRENIALNSAIIRAAGGSAAAAPLVWGVTRAAELVGGWHAPDVVVAADVVYRRELFQPLLQALADLSECPPGNSNAQAFHSVRSQGSPCHNHRSIHSGFACQSTCWCTEYAPSPRLVCPLFQAAQTRESCWRM